MVQACPRSWALAALAIVCGFSQYRAQIAWVRTALDFVTRIEAGATHIGVLADIDLEDFVSESQEVTFRNVTVLPFTILPTTKSITGYCSSNGGQTGALSDSPCTITTAQTLFSATSTSLLLSNLNLKISPKYSAASQFLYDWTQVELMAVERSSIWLSRMSFNGTGNSEDLYHTGISAVQSSVYAERCHFNLFTGAHGAAISIVDSSSLALYKSSMLGNRAGILMPSDLQAVTESLETVVAPITEVHISSRTLFKQSSFTNNGDKQGASAASPAGDLIAFDSTMIYKDDDTMINVETTCGGGTDCKQYMEATFQPLPCAGGSPVPFLIGKEDWVLATQQEVADSTNLPDKLVLAMPWVEAKCADVTPKAQFPAKKDNSIRTEWIVIVSIGGTAVALSIIGQTIPVMLAWLHWCCCLRCGTQKAVYEA